MLLDADVSSLQVIFIAYGGSFGVAKASELIPSGVLMLIIKPKLHVIKSK